MTSPIAESPASSRKITDAVLVQLAARALGMIASIGTVAVTTRHLGITDYGVLTTAVVFVGLWTSLTELGVGAVIVRRVTSGTGQLAELAGVNLGLSIVYCVPLAVVAGAVGLLVYHDRPMVDGVLVVVCASLVPTALASCFNPIFMTTMRFATVAVSDLVSRLASLAATGIVIACGGGLVWFGVVQLVPPMVQLLFLGVSAYRLDGFHVRFDRAASMDLLRESLPQTGVLIIGVLYWRADAVILTLLGSVREVGAYGLGYTIAFTTSVISSFYLASSLSTMTGRFAADRRAFASFVGSGVEAMLFLGLPIAVIGSVLARPLVGLLASSSFAGPAAVPLSILLVSVALTFVTGVLSQALFAARDQRFLLRLNIVNLVGNVVLNLVLVPHFGAIGSAVALLISEVSGLVVASWRLHHLSPFRPPLAFTARLLVPLLAAAGVAFAARPLPVIVAVVLAGLAYVAVSLVLGPVRVSTVRRLREGQADTR